MTDKAYELFNLILSGEGDWDYSTLESLLDITRKESYDEGYKKAKSEQPTIKPLRFDNGIATTPVGEYLIYERIGPDGIRWSINWNDYYESSEEEAVKACNEHYSNIIKSCFEQQNDPES